MKRNCAYLVALIVLAFVGMSFGQVAMGIPPFSSIGGGPFDQINLGNLNVHFSIPIVNKAGRGMPFTYNVSYDNSVWTPIGAAGHQGWQLSTTGGWQGLTQITSANVAYSTTIMSGHCGTMGQYTWQSWQYSNFVYEDSSGTQHPISYSPYYITSTGTTFQNCPATGPNPATPSSVLATDGSGYSMTAIPGQGSVSTSIGSSNGATLTPSTVKDANGNEITNNGSVYTDTLGQTALTVTGLGTPSSPILLTYTGPSGSQHYTVNYAATSVATNFGCSGISEFSGTVNLVSSINLPDGSSYSFSYETNGTKYTGRLKEITLPTGGTITYAYSGINCADGSTTGMTRTVSPGGQWTYTRTDVSGNHWQTKVTTPPDPSVGDDTVIDFQKDSAPTLTNNFFETQRISYQGSAPTTPLRTAIACYNAPSGTTPTPSTCPATSVSSPLLRITAFQYVPNTSGVESETDSTYDTFGLIHEVDAYDYGSGAVGSLRRKVLTNYATLGNGIVDRPSSVTTTDGSGSIKALTSYSYDGTAVTTTGGTPQHVSISGSRGNLTSASVDANSSTNLYRSFSYYDTGVLNTSTDASTSSTSPGSTTTYVYGTGSCGNSFPTSVAMPLSLSTSATWNCVGGVQLTSTDVNGNITTTAYTDPNFWRPASTTDPATNVLHYNYYNPAPPPARAETYMFFNGNQSISEQLTTVDGFGRTSVVQRQQAPGVNNFETTETDYDSVGRVYKTYLPYSSTSYGQTNPGGPGTTQTYDALNRPLVTTDGGGGTVAYSYTNNDVLQTIGPAPTGENAKRKQLEYDGLGRLTSVCEITSGTTAYPGGTCGQRNPQTGYWTKYSYDALGDLIQVTQNAQNTLSLQTRTYAYDMLSRLTSETNPESGTNIYVYDVTGASSCNGGETFPGDLVRKVDANGTNTCFYYDTLHRLTDVGTNQNSVNGCKRFRYDNSTGVLNSRPSGVSVSNTLGRLVEVETDPCIIWPITQAAIITDEWFGYDTLGNQTDVYQSTPASGGYYHSTATYYPNGAVNTLTTPVGSPTITYNVDGEGRTSAVSSSSGQNPVSATSYNTAGQVTGVTFGSGDGDTYQFDTNTGRMNQYQFKMGTLTDTGVLGWNANSSLGSLSITDQINPANTQTCTYVHDDMSRVASAHCGSVWSQDFTYDPFGNLTKAGSIAWNPVYNTATNRYTIGGTSYDSNGNLLTDTFHTYTYDADGNATSSDGKGLIYDALGRMVQAGSTSLLMGPTGSKPLASMSGQTVNERFVPLPGGGMMRSAYGYRHGDWLGSARLLTSFTQTLQYDAAYAPFGEDYSEAGPNQDLGFTQGATDSLGILQTHGTYDFPFRKYPATQGRWMTPDPAGMGAADPTNPQSWNRYAYVMNNPLNAIDPFGLDYCTPDNPTGCCNPLSDATQCGSYCPPEYGYCGVGVCNYDPDFCIPSGGGGGGNGEEGGSGGNPGPVPPSAPAPVRTGNVWPDNESLGLPGGLNVHPLSLGDFFGLTPGTGCEFGPVCTPLGSNFTSVALPTTATVCGSNPEVCGTIGLGALAEIAQIYATKKLAEKAVGLINRCAEVKEECIDKCTEDVLLGSRPFFDMSGPFFRCIRECMEAAGCSD